MKTTVNRPVRKWASLLLLPAIAVFLWAFAKPAYSISFVNQEDVISINDTIKEVKRNAKITIEPTKGNDYMKIERSTVEDSKRPLYIVDGKKLDLRAGEDLESHVTVENIESIDVLKDKSATDFYGAKGKNGVIIITTKRANPGDITSANNTQKQFHPNKVINLSTKNGRNITAIQRDTVLGIQGKPLYIIDGKEQDSQVLKDIDPKNIESIDVLKDKTATGFYGEKGKNGVIVIKTKDKYVFDQQNAVMREKVLVIIDGKEYYHQSIKNIDSLVDVDNIDSMAVWKGETAIEKYGEKGKNGVVVITTK
jgi:TonB-dependent SusC/RagA subfamily outer membrane receptor